MEADLLELEHVFGYSGRYQQTAIFHSTDPSFILYTIGALIVIENINDKHSQFFLRGHDNDISALAISRNGLLIASGQIGSQLQKNHEAPVILWNYRNRAPVTQFGGMTGKVTKVEFTADSMFLAASTEDGRLQVWDCRDGSVVYNRRSEFPVSTFAWGPVSDSGQGLPGASRHPSYKLVMSYSGQLVVNRFDYDISSMSYRISPSNCQQPSSGMNRNFSCSIIDSSGDYLYAGTPSGELVVYNITNQVFRGSVPISSNGLLALLEINGVIYAGSGDGKIKQLTGRDGKWAVVAEMQVPGRVMSLSPQSDKSEILCATSLGCIFRMSPQNLSNVLHSESPVGSVKDVSFGNRSDMFLVVDAAGFARIWDSSDYSVVFRAGPNSRAEGTSCAVGDDGSVITGWKDGFIRCYDPSNSQLRWEIQNAHRGAVTSVYMNQNYILSGGEDGTLRLWGRQNHQLLTQFTDNRRALTRVMPDVIQPHLVHSCGVDRIINTYDLKLERRVVRHEIGNGAIFDMSQRKDNENELITCGIGGAILFWDCDEVNPVQQIAYRGQLNALDVSPSGKYLAAGSEEGELFIFEIRTLQCIAQGIGHSSRINRLKWSPDEKQVVTVSDDCSIALWNFYA